MRLDFNVLWVEDQPQNVQSSAEAIDRRIRKHGFRLVKEFALSVADAKPLLSSEIYGDHIDLVVMDYDLGAGPKGDKGVQEVRSTFPYKDIVFYSAQTPSLSSMIASQQLQGVYCSDRDGLPDVVYGVFESLTKKVLDIDHARGIVMGSSSDIDGLVVDSLNAHLNKDAGALSNDAKAFIQARLKEIRERFDKSVEGILNATKLDELYVHHGVYTSVDRMNLLRKLMELGKIQEDGCKAIKAYANATVPKRNLLAHVRVKREGFSRKLFDKDGKEFSSEEMQTLLQSMLVHQEAMEKLLGLISSPQP